MPRTKKPELQPKPPERPTSPWTLEVIEKTLTAKGWPAMSPFWKSTIERIYRSKKRFVTGRGGRRSGKSSTLAGKVAVFEVISNRHVVPPGDIGYFAIISADKDQAQERLDTAHKALTGLGIAHRKTANEITLTDKNVGIKAFAATTSAVVSFTCIGYICDEQAHWADKDTGANPAREVLGLLRPTMATMPNAIGWHVSAPHSTLDLHHEMFELGETDHQSVFFCTSVEGNPTLTEDMIYQLEPDEPTRMCAYYCVPMASDESKFFPAAFIDDATKMHFTGRVERISSGGDFAFVRNSSALAVVSKLDGDLYRGDIFEERIPGVKPLVPSTTVKDLAGIASTVGADSMACDLHYFETIREHTENLPLGLLAYPTDQNAECYVALRVLLSEHRIDLSNAPPKLIAQLKETTGQPTQTGISIKNKTVAGAHGDLVSALVAAVWSHSQEAPGDNIASGERRFGRADQSGDGEVNGMPPESWMN